MSSFVETHGYQLRFVPEELWQSLSDKLNNDILDAGEVFEFGLEEDEDGGTEYFVKLKDDASLSRHSNVYLVDHAWTTTLPTARSDLERNPALLQRLCDLMGIVDDEKDVQVKEVLEEGMWRVNQHYHFGRGTQEEASVWYIMDELGTRVRHSDSPNFCFQPFFYAEKGVCYTLMWPIDAVPAGAEVTRDFLPGVADKEQRAARLYAWFGERDISEETFLEKYEHHRQALQDISQAHAARVSQTQNDQIRHENKQRTTTLASPASPCERGVLRVFTDMPTVAGALASCGGYAIAESADAADVYWPYAQLSPADWAHLPTHLMIGQFPKESAFTCKDLLIATITSAFGQPDWLPESFNMETQLYELLGYVLQLKRSGLDSTCIVKPWNLARGIGHVITASPACMIRMMEEGPRVACKYVEDPSLYAGIKYDLRYMVAVKSFAPLQLYVHKGFLVRFANKPFGMDDLCDYETHLTVMTFTPFPLRDLPCAQFVAEFPANVSDQAPWDHVQREIHRVIEHTFRAASFQYASPLPNLHNCRGIYGVDIILRSDLQPLLLEVNFNPNSVRFLQHEPAFFADAFDLLFKDVSHSDLKGAPFVRLA